MGCDVEDTHLVAFEKPEENGNSCQKQVDHSLFGGREGKGKGKGKRKGKKERFPLFYLLSDS